MNAYEITKEYDQINELMITLEAMKEAGEDVTAFEADTKKYIQQLDGNLYEKADNIAKVLRNFDIMITGRKDEARRLNDAARAFEARSDYVKNNLLLPMLEASGNRKLECKTFTVSLRSSKSVEVTDEEAIPFEYLKIKEVRSVDKIGLKKWLNEGNEASGAKIVQRESVQIK